MSDVIRTELLSLVGERESFDRRDFIVTSLGYGGADAGIPAETVEKMFAAIKAGGTKKSEYVIYPDAPHAFNADYRPSYRKAAAQDGWKRALAWFKANGVA